MWSAPYEHFEGRMAGGSPINHENIMVHGVQEISAALYNHTAYFRPHLEDNFGLLTLVNKNLPVTQEGEIFVYRKKGHIPDDDLGFHPRNLQYTTTKTPHGARTIMNFHSLWNGKGKTDNEDRFVQSDKIIDLIKTFSHPYVLCGDFNLLPDTESLKKLERFGLRNLIKEYNITSTRTSYYTKEHKFADYMLISPGIEIIDFKILPDEVSDHAPMYLEFV